MFTNFCSGQQFNNRKESTETPFCFIGNYIKLPPKDNIIKKLL